MPTYDYRCTQCALPFNAHHAIPAPRPDCPACGGASERVILSAPAIHGNMARGRDLAMRSLQTKPEPEKTHGPGCGCGYHPRA